MILITDILIWFKTIDYQAPGNQSEEKYKQTADKYEWVKDQESKIYLLSIYSKSQRENIPDDEILQILKDIGLKLEDSPETKWC